MGATPVYALPYPEPTDPADVPIDMKELAERTEAVLAGPPFAVNLFADVATDEQTASSGAYVDLTTVGPQVTIPTAGTYELSYGAEMYLGAGAPNVASASPAFGATAPTDADAVVASPSANSAAFSVARTTRKAGLAAGTVVKLQYKGGGGAPHFRKRWLSARRVA